MLLSTLFVSAINAAHPAFALGNAAIQTPTAKNATVRAFQAIDKGQWDVGRRLIMQTRDPLAAKLYYWKSLTTDQDEFGYNRLVQFIRQNPHWPGIPGLKKEAERQMPNDLRPTDVLAWFDDYTPKTVRGVDLYMEALVGAGKATQAREFLSSWWTTTKISREGQKDIYRKYGRYINRDAHRRRLDAMLFQGQSQNALAVAQVLGAGYPELARARIALSGKKTNVEGLLAAVPQSLQNDPGLLYERLKWRRKKDLNNGAIEILQRAPDSKKLQNPKDWWLERHIVIRRLIEQRKYKGAYQLASRHRQKEGFPFAQAEWMSGWLALSFLNDAPKALQHFEALYSHVKTPVSKARGAYWSGKAAQKLGQGEVARQWFERAAQYQTVFYGQMAGAELGLKSALPYAAPPVLSPERMAGLKSHEMVQAAEILFKAGLRKDAKRFLQTFIDEPVKGQVVADQEAALRYHFAAQKASEMKLYDTAVRIAKRATREGLFLTSQAYPVMVDKLQDVNVEWALVHSLIRQESLFDVNARSHAGALGLMQLMPGTARDVARSLGVAHQNGWLTARPAHNIRLGTQYLNDLIVRYGGSYPLAIAAYNAGPGRVDKWLKIYGDPRLGSVDIVTWIESIPIYETRNYVQRVMESVYVYRLRLKGIQETPREAIHIAMRYRQ